MSVCVCGPVNPCYSTLSIPLPLRVNIGLTTCNAILSYACLTPKEPQPLFSPGCVCVCVCDCHSVSTCNSYCLFFNCSASSSFLFLLLSSITSTSPFLASSFSSLFSVPLLHLTLSLHTPLLCSLSQPPFFFL